MSGTGRQAGAGGADRGAGALPSGHGVVSRRAVLRAGAVAVLGAAATACGAERGGRTGHAGSTATSAPGGAQRTTTTAVTPTTTATTTARVTSTTTSGGGPPTAADWKGLAEVLAGRLSLPGDPSYPLDRELYDPRWDSVGPAGIAYCAGADDVARAIGFAREHGLALAARSGGHSYGGYSTTSGLVVDVSTMSSVAASGGTAHVGAGAQLVDVYSGLAAAGAGVPGGSCPTVGIAGLALGGGIGVMDRLYGLTCDVVTSLELVTADGRVVQADEATNPDLFWACRGGGGGNFGVVTELRMATFPAPDLVLFGAAWPWSAASQLLPAWLEWCQGAPDELWSNCILSTGAGSGMTVNVGGAWVGSEADARSLLRRLALAAGPPTGQVLGTSSFEQAMYIEAGCRGLSQAACHLRGRNPGGTLGRSTAVAKSDLLTGPLGDAGTGAVLAGLEERLSQGAPGSVAYDSLGGAVNRVPPGATAFVHRDAVASVQYSATWSDLPAPTELASAQTWLDRWYGTLRPYVSGQAYQNYIDPHLSGWQHAYYGANLPRLQRVKARWDPDDFFHFAQSIPLP